MSCGQINRQDTAESPVDLLKRAARLRQHATHFGCDPIAAGLEQYADELEARAHQSTRRVACAA
jgi:hypothetical protein